MAEEQDQEKSNKPGCATSLFLLGVAAIAGAIWLMSRWDNLPGLGKAGAVVLVVLGTLMALPLLVLWGIRIFIRVVLGRMLKELAKAGEQIVGGAKAMYDRVHEFRPATEEDFAPLDRNYYERMTRELSDAGCRHLGDIVDATIEQLQGVSPVIRIMASPDGMTTVSFYHLLSQERSRGKGKRLICDVESEFDDGTFLVTSNTEGLDLMTPPAGIQRRQHSLKTPVAELVRAHEAEKQKLLAAKTGVNCVTIDTLEDAIESQRRQQAVKNAFRKQIGYVDPAEVRRVASTVSDDQDLADLSAQAADKARKRRRR